MTDKARELAARAALLVGGVLAAAVLLEGALQIAPIVVRATAPEPSAATTMAGGRRILSVGDSNTYGADQHPTALGSEVAAKLLADWLDARWRS